MPAVIARAIAILIGYHAKLFPNLYFSLAQEFVVTSVEQKIGGDHSSSRKGILMSNKTTALFACLVILTGCGTVPRSTGALPVGPDTYRIMARAPMGNSLESQKMAFIEAGSYCESMGRRVLVTNTRDPRDMSGYEITFRCLNAGDPDLVRPNLQKTPDTVIQVR